MDFIQIEVKVREETGSSAMRRLRHAGHIPGVLYGLKQRNLALTIPGDELERFIRSGSHLVELTMGDQQRDAILREVQQHPITEEILHVDFVRVDKKATVQDQVKVAYKGIAPGTKEGGLFQGILDHIKVEARPRDLPEEILLDISGLHVGDAIYVRDITVPESVALVDSPDDLVAHVVAIRGVEVDEEETEEDGGTPSEPEVIGKAEETAGSGS